MEEQKNNVKIDPEGCKCPMCQWKTGEWHHGCGHRHFILRLILGIVILGFVFCLGAAFGRATARFARVYNRGGYNMMYPGGGWSGSVPMMHGQWMNPVQQSATTTQT